MFERTQTVRESFFRNRENAMTLVGAFFEVERELLLPPSFSDVEMLALAF